MFDLSDPKVQAMLAAASGLLAPVNRKGGAGFAQAASRGLHEGLLGYNVADEARRRNQGADMSTRMAQMQYDQAQKGQQFDQALAAGYKPAQNMNPVQNDDQGYALPPAMSQPGFDFSGAAKIDPMRAMQLQQQMQPKPEMRTFTPGQRLVEMGPNGPVERYAAPDKPKHEPGDTREIKAGRQIITQTWNGKGWDNSYKSAMDAPDKPDKPTAGVYDAERGILVDPRSGAATPVIGNDGKPIPAKVPEAAKKELMSIDQEIASIQGAVDAVKKTPSAFSMKRGLATMAGPIPESAAGRFDSKDEQQARGYVYNVVSKSINERAGAAQSAQELARLRSFLPAETDSPGQIDAKLQGYMQYLKDRRGAVPGGKSQGQADPLGIR